MKILVVFDSVFRNTEKIAQAIGSELGVQAIPIKLLKMDLLRGLDLLVMGSPTRGFHPTQGITEFIDSLPKNSLADIRVAVFDTRIELETIKSKALRFMVDKGGYAARKMAKELKERGATLVASPEGFFITGEKGPLKEGELERASEWARCLQPQLREIEHKKWTFTEKPCCPETNQL